MEAVGTSGIASVGTQLLYLLQDLTGLGGWHRWVVGVFNCDSYPFMPALSQAVTRVQRPRRAGW